jgi:hypothetical protein
MYKMVIKYPNVRKIFQIATKYINIFQSKALQNCPKFGFFGLKINHLATLLATLNFLKSKYILKNLKGLEFSIVLSL